MFAFLLFPCVQQKIVVILDDAFDVAQVAFSKSAFAFNPDRVKPELRFISAFVYVT
jgi:hypothetical protein